ncbi:endopeptidase La [Candidatus Finniella inopinata]|uniref:Lon protease n=1 Tax=Candidatus Finniella inopinata TaxID=1696036 RepID=A0A4Q7DIP2_9PROT|nr:endopeptidase La [Candidatus Finniella inopinata]RZI46602.1 endopeptidase La [Candidatus Finniella inopinata]
MQKIKKRYPVLPLRDIVVFPHMIVPLFVGREKSVLALEEVMQTEHKLILLITQKNSAQDFPSAQDLHKVGIIGTILQMLKLPDGTVKVLVEARDRAKVTKFERHEDFLVAEVETIDEIVHDDDETEALCRTIVTEFEQYIKLNRKIPPDVLITINQIEEAGKLADTISSYFNLKIADKQVLLECADINKRLEKVLTFIENENNVMQVEKKIRTRVKRQMEKTQREYYLNEQMKAIHKELGEGEEGKDEIAEIELRIKNTKFSKEAREKATAEVKKLRLMNQSSAEATVVRNYLDWLLSIPWSKPKKTKCDLKQAQDFLNREHYGLEKVKERILEYLAVQTRVGKVRGQILCLVGPPGVGKTSLGKSVAEATGRDFVRVALGGVRDESEIRGHRRTYIGSMPGKIIQGMKKAKTSNPLFLLDEIDKVGSDWRGDPSSALLEVLDPEQNATFSDHYLEVDYDLSDVMFITTANTLKMPQPLLDRMEIIRIPGYTEDEKLAIAQNYLVPKQVSAHGLKKGELEVTQEALVSLIRTYTREAGVRNLEREIANLARKAIKQILTDSKTSIVVTKDTLEQYAGVTRYTYGQAEVDDSVGTVTGLAWTEVGGDLLSIEAVVIPGKGKPIFTGKLGDVMQESIQAALSYVRSRAHLFGLQANLFEKRDIHIHFPEGAIPKDGPSAGIGVCTAIVSAFTGIPVKKDVAMTGEITLRGRVLQIGGLKEKLLAAHRGGIKTVLIPIQNQKDLQEIPENVKAGLTIIPVSTIDEVLKLALTHQPQPIPFQDFDPIIAQPPTLSVSKEQGAPLTH